MLNNPDGREFYYEADVPDTADLSYKLLEHTWSFGFQANGKIQCVKTSINRRAITMHELIMKDVPHKPEQTIIAHLDGNPLNNRRSNLRWVTRSVSQHSTRDAENKPRRGIKHGNPLAYMTTKLNSCRPWMAMLMVGRVPYRSKSVSTAREAEEQYLILKHLHHPETPAIWYEQYAACQASGYWDAKDAANGTAKWTIVGTVVV
jgi:hypothetical protein